MSKFKSHFKIGTFSRFSLALAPDHLGEGVAGAGLIPALLPFSRTQINTILYIILSTRSYTAFFHPFASILIWLTEAL